MKTLNNNIESQLEKILEEKTKPCSRSEWLEDIERSKDSPYDYRVDHTRRVVKLAKRISREMNADTEVIVLAAWLHDIAKPGNHGVPNHGAKSAEMASEILKEMGYDDGIISRVREMICKHVGLILEKELEPLEAQILWEADKLDKLGIVGYVHGIIIYPRRQPGKTMYDLSKWLREFFPLADRIAVSMYTPIGRQIAQERLKHLKEMSRMLEYELTIHHGDDMDE